MLTDLEKRADKVRSGIRTGAEEAVADHRLTPLAGHIADYFAHQAAPGVNSKATGNARDRLRRVRKDCEFRRPADDRSRRVAQHGMSLPFRTVLQ